MSAKQIAIFASGRGSNAEKIIAYFENRQDVTIRMIVSNKPNAGVLTLAKAKNIETLLIDRESFYQSEIILDQFQSADIDIIVLAGFLWLVPSYLTSAYKDRIINIHPALLPKYGGKGMYGHRVHEAVKLNKEEVSGITIHLVNEAYDEGKHLFQLSCDLEPEDDAEAIAAKVLVLEHQYYPQIVDQYLDNLDKKWSKT